MVKNHLKSLSAPRTWSIKRKNNVYITRPQGSGQKLDFCMPIGIIFKQILKYCKTSREVRIILQEKEILVDGKRVKRTDDSIGLFSVLTIVPTNEYFRLIITKKNKLELKKIEKTESTIKPTVITNKKVLAKDKIQLNLSDGRNLIIKKNEYETQNTLIITLPTQEIKNYIELKKGTQITLIGGKHVGTTGTIDMIEGKKISFLSEDKKVYETEKKYAVAIGEKKAIVTV